MALPTRVRRTERNNSVHYRKFIPGRGQYELRPEVEAQQAYVTLLDSASKPLKMLVFGKAESDDGIRFGKRRSIGLDFLAIPLRIAIPSAAPDAVSITGPATAVTANTDWLKLVALDFTGSGMSQPILHDDAILPRHPADNILSRDQLN